MKKLSVLYYFMFAVLVFFFDSCKPKHDHDPCEIHEMKHYYKVYPGIFSPSADVRSNDDTFFDYCKLNNLPRKYFENSNNNLLFKPGSTIKIYQYVRDISSKMDFDQVVLGKDTIIVLINALLLNNVEDESQKGARTIMGRGNMSCIPKFEQNAKNDLFFFEEKGNLYVPLMTADHKTAKNEIVNFLTNYNFKISQDDYDVLNYIYKKEKLIEGGMDTIKNVVYLSIYKPNSDVSYLKIKEFK